MIVQQFVQDNNNETMKTSHFWPPWWGAGDDEFPRKMPTILKAFSQHDIIMPGELQGVYCDSFDKNTAKYLELTACGECKK